MDRFVVRATSSAAKRSSTPKRMRTEQRNISAFSVSDQVEPLRARELQDDSAAAEDAFERGSDDDHDASADDDAHHQRVQVEDDDDDDEEYDPTRPAITTSRHTTTSTSRAHAVVRYHRDGSIKSPPMPAALRKRVCMYVEDRLQRNTWPTRTDELCRWDLQPFSGFPIGIPQSYDPKTRRYSLFGYFCSPNCAAAYAKDAARGSISFATLHLACFLTDWFGASIHRQSAINPAPPRAKLSMLYAKYAKSGHSDAMARAVAAFRRDAMRLACREQPPPFVRVTALVEEEERQQEQRDQHERRLQLMQQPARPIVLTDRGQREQMVYVRKRQREPTLDDMGAIERLMGVRIARPTVQG